ncbi:MAG: hypothetical protein ACKN9V_02350 [Pseudomonadota bacterium]
MKKLFILSSFFFVAQTTSFAGESANGTHGWDANKMIQGWGKNRREQESFDSSFAAIKRALDQETDPEQLNFLLQWAERLSAEQTFIKNRVEKFLEDPTVNSKSKNELLNRLSLYQERIDNLKSVQERIKKAQNPNTLETQSKEAVRLEALQRQHQLEIQEKEALKQLEELKLLLEAVQKEI